MLMALQAPSWPLRHPGGAIWGHPKTNQILRKILNPTAMHSAFKNEDADSGAAAEFARMIIEREASGGPQQVVQQRRDPSHLLPPNAVCMAILSALQRNDYPETDAGIATAFNFTKPWQEPGEESSQQAATAVPLFDRHHRRSWAAKEAWLGWDEFAAALHSPPFEAFLECDEWSATSPLQFPSQRNENKAVQAVAVRSRNRSFSFTFCLEREEAGGFKGCWLVAGVRQGDYSV